LLKDRWRCLHCGKGFYEPEGYERYSDKKNFQLSCPYCHAFTTEKVEKQIKKAESNAKNTKTPSRKRSWLLKYKDFIECFK